jgi:hypothetical protein
MSNVDEVLQPGQLSLSEFASTANREHEEVLAAGITMVEHAIAAGEALLAAWGRWLERHFHASDWTAKVYIKLAKHQVAVRANLDHPTMTEAIGYLRGLPETSDKNRISPSLKAEAVRLRRGGENESAIARQLGISRTAVRYNTDPNFRMRHINAQRKRNAQSRAALDRANRESTIKTRVRTLGGAYAELYSMTERMQDVLGQAHREATDSETREALSKAGQHYRKMRDEIVRGLGVA